MDPLQGVESRARPRQPAGSGVIEAITDGFGESALGDGEVLHQVLEAEAGRAGTLWYEDSLDPSMGRLGRSFRYAAFEIGF